jgi:hypothetical protein
MAHDPHDRKLRSGPRRLTEVDYVAVMVDEVTQADWCQIVRNAKKAALEGDAQARTWLSQHLMGRPKSAAPTPLVVVTQGGDYNPLVSPSARRRLPGDFDESPE